PRERLVLVGDFPLRIAGRGARREVDLRLVTLAQAHEARGLLRERAQEDEQEARRKGIERARVARPRARPVAQAADDRERRGAGRLVDEHESRRLERSRRHWLPRKTRGG